MKRPATILGAIGLLGCQTTSRVLELHTVRQPQESRLIVDHKNEMEARAYRIRQSMTEALLNQERVGDERGRMPVQKNGVAPDKLRSFFESAGVPFPDGSTISYNARMGTLFVKNKRENLYVLERILDDVDAEGQVEISAKLLAVSGPQALSALKERPLSIQRLSEFVGRGIAVMDSIQAVGISGEQASLAGTAAVPAEASPSQTNFPAATECASRLIFTPTVGADRYTVNVAMAWDGVIRDKFRGDSAGKQDPVVRTIHLSTHFFISDGQSLAFDLPVQPKTDDLDFWLLVTLRLVDPEGVPVHMLLSERAVR